MAISGSTATSCPDAAYSSPEGTIECRNPVDPNDPTHTGPNDPNCTSCAFIKKRPELRRALPGGTKGFLAPMDDQLNVRFFNQKQRFGVFVGYPTSRYVRGLSKNAVPDSRHDHDAKGSYVGDTQANCVSPLFATNLPTAPGGELCGAQRGPRTPNLVYYAAIAGVPHQLLQVDPRSPAASRVVTRHHAISDRHGNVRSTRKSRAKIPKVLPEG